MQLLMRRPEIEGFISICPPANLYDFSFLAPCPSSGLIIHGDKDAVVPPKDVTTLVDKLKTQKGIVIEQKVIPGANHFFDGKVEPLLTNIGAYLDKRLKDRAQADRCGVADAHNVFCLWPHSLQVNSTRACPGGAATRFGAPHFPHLVSMRVSPCLTATALRSMASRTSRSASSRLSCFDICFLSDSKCAAS